MTLNDRLDYFGQTINTAAGVQGLAGAEEVYVSDDVIAFPGVKALLKGCKLFGGKVKLKGIQEAMQVYKIVAPDFEGAGDGALGGAAAAGLKASAGAAAAKRAP